MKPIINLDYIVAAILPVQATLSRLIISATNINDGFDIPPLEIRGTFQGIVDFPALEQFEALLPFLMGTFSSFGTSPLVRVVPKNIRSLTINDDLYMQDESIYVDGDKQDVGLLSALREWFKDWKSFTPHFRELCLRLYSFSGGDDPDGLWELKTRDQLRDVCAVAGIQVRIIRCDEFSF